MAPALLAYDSSQVINANPAEHSPITSSPLGKSIAPVQSVGTERVEDSLQEQPVVGGPVRPPKPISEEDDNDLYEVSPRGKASLDAAKAFTTSAQPLKAAKLALLDRGGEPPKHKDDPAKSGGSAINAPRGAIISMPTNGKIAPSSQANGLSTIGNTRQARTQGHRNQLQLAATKTSSNAQSNKRTSSAVATQNMAAAIARDASNKREQEKSYQLVAPVSGAMAALRARRPDLPTTRLPAPGAARSKDTRASEACSPLQKRSKNVMSPVRKGAKARESVQAHLKEVPPSHQLRTSAVALGTQWSKTGLGAKERQTIDTRSEAHSATHVEHGKPIKAHQTLSGKLKPLENTSHNADNQALRQSTYDVPASPDVVQPEACRKNGQATGKLPCRKRVVNDRDGDAPTSESNSSDLNAEKQKLDPSYTVGRAKKETSSSRGPTRKQPARPSKVGTQINNRKSESNHPKLSSRQDDRDTQRSIAGAETADPVKGRDEHHHNESIENFEHQVVDFEQDGGPRYMEAQKRFVKADETPRTAEHGKVTHTPVKQAQMASPLAHHKYDHGTFRENQVIVLSDRVETSSPLPPESEKRKTSTSAANKEIKTMHQPVQHLRTPTAPRSSLPEVRDLSADRTHSRLLDDSAARKTTIISFDKSGPRNQGTLFTRKTVIEPVPPSNRGATKGVYNAAPDRNVNAGRGAKRELFSASATANKGPSKEKHILLGNVATEVGDALDAFLRKPPKPELVSTAVALTESFKQRTSPDDRANAVLEDEDEDQYALMHDFEGPTLTDADPIVIPPRANGAEKVYTASQQAMPPPVKIPSLARDSGPASVVPSMTRHAAHQSLSLPKKLASDSSGKRTPSPANLSSFEAKRRKIDSESQSQPQLNSTAMQYPKELSRTEAPPTVSAAQGRGAAGIKPTNPSRQGSRGTVDIHGSPIPKDLIVPEESTVLETYSQNARMSSDEIPSGNQILVAPLALQIGETNSKDLYRPPPSAQAEASFTAMEYLLAPPHKPSIATSREVIEQPDQDQVLLNMPTREPDTPRISMNSAQKKPAAMQSSVLAIALRVLMADPAQSKQQQSKPGLKFEDDPDKTLVEPTSRPRERPPEPPLPASKLCEAAPTQHQSYEIPRTKRQLSSSTDSSSNISEEPDTQTSEMRAIGAWRQALKPYQMNLFDELVNISHRLVAHLVDQETAARHVVDDFQRRGERIVEVLEQSHLEEYHRSLELLEERRQQTHKQLKKTSKKLGVCKATVQKAKEERNRRREERGEDMRRLENLLAERF